MPQINDNYLKLKAGYLFPEIGRRVKAFSAEHPDAKLIRLGIGDVTEPLPPAVIEAMHRAVDEMATHHGFHGYGPEQGYEFLRDAIAQHDYAPRGCDISADEIFVSDGSKCDTANLLDILGPDNAVAVTDPVYPVYVDTNVMVGRTGPANERGEYDGLIYLRATAENNFSPPLPDRRADVIYLCYPNNPTGTVASRETLQKWVDYARDNRSLILFDAAYEAFITDESIPHSIYEIDGARECAIEFRSFSKTAGFTGVRAAFAVVPKSLMGRSSDGTEIPMHGLWNRRQSTKFNGVSYVVLACRRRDLHARGQGPDSRPHRPLPDQRRPHPHGDAGARPDRPRRRQRPVLLGPNPRRPDQLAGVRQAAGRGPHRQHPRQWLRRGGRGVCAA